MLAEQSLNNKIQNKMHKELDFIKMNGAGNDFVIIDARKKTIELLPNDCKDICDREFGIGCDQLVIIEESANFDCYMSIYNQDGSTAEACGNATRCVASLLFEENLSLSKVIIETIVGALECFKEPNSMIAVKMGKVKFGWQDIPLAIEQNTQGFDLLGQKIYCANIGNPHAVIFVDQKVHDNEIYNLGPQIENYTLFPKKTNVEFAQITSEMHISARVWERGVGETKACGSGACAIAAIAIKNKLVKSEKVMISYPGGDIIIDWNGDMDRPLVMTGDCEKEFQGHICFDIHNKINFNFKK